MLMRQRGGALSAAPPPAAAAEHAPRERKRVRGKSWRHDADQLQVGGQHSGKTISLSIAFFPPLSIGMKRLFGKEIKSRERETGGTLSVLLGHPSNEETRSHGSPTEG